MTETCPDDALEDAFEKQRERLVGVAYRVLGSYADAEDVVQEAWLRLARQDANGIHNLPGWLTSVVGRICIDVLRARKARRESTHVESHSEWLVTEDDAGNPEDDAVRGEVRRLGVDGGA